MYFKVQRNEAGYRFISILSEKYNAKKTDIWINKEIPTENDLLFFPIQNAKLSRTGKGSLVIKPHKNQIVDCIKIDSLYRGNLDISLCRDCSDIELNLLENNESIEVFTQYHSPAGALGQSKLIFVSIKSNITIYWKSQVKHNQTQGHVKVII